jgi:hypothetical protein
MPPKKRTARYRELTTAERMLAAIGPSPAALVRAGLSPRKAHAVEGAWDKWDEERGLAWRVLAGIPTAADRLRLEAGGPPEPSDPPEPPGWGWP